MLDSTDEPIIDQPAPVRANQATTCDAGDDAGDMELLRPALIADIVRVAGTIAHPRGLALRQYLEAGGRFTTGTIVALGGWRLLCQSAGVRCGVGGGQPKRLRGWQKTKRPMPLGQFDAAIDRALGRVVPPKGCSTWWGSRAAAGRGTSRSAAKCR
jgi:hypothetical protein